MELIVRTTYVKVFKDPNKLEEMMRLRNEGYTYQRLAIKYHVDKQAIRYQCLKNGCPVKVVITHPPDRYSDYMAMERLKRWKSLIQLYGEPSTVK